MKLFTNTILTLIISLLGLNIGSAAESYMIHLDKPFYFTGEKVLFKLYYPETKDEVVVRVLLLDGSNEVKQDVFSKSTKSDFLASCLSLPFNYESGTYRLVFNSNVEKNGSYEEVTLAEIAIPIYNDLSTGEFSSSSMPMLQGLDQYKVENSLSIQAEVVQKEVSSRGQVNVNISVKNESGSAASKSSVSVAVIPKVVQETTGSGLNYLAQGPIFTNPVHESLTNEVYYNGTIFNRGDRPVQLNVIGAYSDQYKSMQYTKSNAEGLFTMNFPGLKGRQTIQFLHYEKEIDNVKVKLSPAVSKEHTLNGVFFSEGMAGMLAESKLSKKMDQYFKTTPYISRLQSDEEAVKTAKSDVTFVVNEYEKFDQVYDFFSELITPLTFKKVKGEIKATMNNPKSNQAVATLLAGNPLFIVDGKMTRNADYAGKLKMSNIETIELVYSPNVLRKRFNVLGLSGVIIINTITPVFDFPASDSDDVFEVDGLSGSCSFSEFTAGSAAENIPYFRSTIYWNADLRTDASGNLDVSFIHPDNIGEYTIVIVSQDVNGARGTQVVEYSVTPKQEK